MADEEPIDSERRSLIPESHPSKFGITENPEGSANMGRPSPKQTMAGEKPADKMQAHEETAKMGPKQPISTRQPIEVPPLSPQPKKQKKKSQLGLRRATEKRGR